MLENPSYYRSKNNVLISDINPGMHKISDYDKLNDPLFLMIGLN